ncbi:ribonuclease 4 [Tamandua tetradactyla]|uniref:ribonuclease 4 n=1 Tax=Tamandua tetradactyla TaxID=48850 RepID=UPI00405399DB
MALPRTHSLLLILLLILLELLVQPSWGQNRLYQRFLRQHVDSQGKGGTVRYCNYMMQKRRMTVPQCKHVNTFIHEDIWDIHNICNNPSTRCNNGMMNCHVGVAKVTDCRETGGSTTQNCRYRATSSTRQIVIACDSNPAVPVHFDR